MRNLIPAVNIIKRNEGCKLQSYQDSGGVWTIGYGHTLGVHQGMTIDQAEADQMLMREVSEFSEHVDLQLRVEVSNNQFCALVDFSYNLGLNALHGSTLLKLINSGASETIIAEEFLKWIYQGRQVLAGLVKRREEERALYLTPDGEA